MGVPLTVEDPRAIVATAKEKLIASAQKLVEKGAFEKAIKEYLRVVQEDDSDVRIWLKIGDLYAKIGKKTEATDTYQRVAQFYSNQGFYLKSVAVYKQILKLEPRLVDVNHRLAELYKQLGLISDAISQYEQVAGFFHKEGKVKEALSAMKQIVELDPETVAARIKLAEMYSRENLPREAIEEFTRAAEQLKEAGRLDEYMKVAERLLFHAPDNKTVTKELARLYIEKNDPRRALPKLQVLFKHDPRDFDVLRLLARAFEGLEQRPKAVSVYKELARILHETGDARGAIDVFRQILVIQPDDADAQNAVSGAPPPSTRRPTLPPPSPPSAPSVSNTGPVRAHATGAERALDSGGHRVYPTNQTGRAAAIPRDVPQPEGPNDSLAEEIAKLLSETDVYIKYNLHAKAIEHLQRVFERQPRHVAGREKLKALYITTGRRDDAITELWALADAADPGRARRYVREIYELDPSNVRAAQALGEPVHTPGVQAPEPEAEDDFGVSIDSGVGQDFGLPTMSRREPPLRNAGEPEDADLAELSDGGVAIDDALLDDGVIGAADLEEDFSDIDLAEDVTSAPIEVVGETSPGLDDDFIPLVIDTGADPTTSAPPPDDESDRFSLAEEEEEPASAASSFDVAGEEPTRFGVPSTSEESFADVVEDRTGLMSAEELRNLEGGPRFAPASTAVSDAGLDEMDFSSVSEEVEARPIARPAELAPPPEPEEIPPLPVVESSSASQRRYAPAPIPDPLRQESSLEDDLDESDFFMQQSLFDEARMMLTSLLERYPNHPLVHAKMKDLDGMDPAPTADVPVISSTNTAELALQADSGEHDFLIEEPSVPVSESISAEMSKISHEPVEVTRRGVIAHGDSPEDFETHFDLGIAYKEMGLIDDAVAEFRIVMKDPAREVQCQLMIGTCYLEKQMFTEAINQFKKGLYVEGITDPEALSLYYELGSAYEKIGDPREALYYYDKVQKRDPQFRDLRRRMRALRGEEQEAEPPPRANDDVDGAFDGLLDEG
jgi:pilus assembly protein FimV